VDDWLLRAHRWALAKAETSRTAPYLKRFMDSNFQSA